MKPQLRAYILVVGRDQEDKPVRKVARYRGHPLAGLMDRYDQMSVAELNATEHNLRDEQTKIEQALTDVEAEKYERLRRRANLTEGWGA